MSKGGLPRIRGGVSHCGRRQVNLMQSSPHTRGCFQDPCLTGTRCSVFPAYAGVFPRSCQVIIHPPRLPRIRGGVSIMHPSYNSSRASSPHTRGCFFSAHSIHTPAEVFPAYAGVFLAYCPGYFIDSGLPRIRGGVSGQNVSFSDIEKSSPHTRGCFSSPRALRLRLRVFPAYAGVFLLLT